METCLKNIRVICVSSGYQVCLKQRLAQADPYLEINI